MIKKMILIVLFISCPHLSAELETWTLSDVYKSRMWRIISINTNSNQTIVQLKRIRSILIYKEDYDPKIIKRLDYIYCEDYTYKVNSRTPEHKLIDQFRKKFEKNGVISFPDTFSTKINIKPGFENFMREMLGIPLTDYTGKKKKKPIQKKKKIEDKKEDNKSRWQITSLVKNDFGYKIIWESKKYKDRKHTWYIFKYSEIYFLLNKLMSQSNKEETIRDFNQFHLNSSNTLFSPNKDFLKCLLESLKISSYFPEKNYFWGPFYEKFFTIENRNSLHLSSQYHYDQKNVENNAPKAAENQTIYHIRYVVETKNSYLIFSKPADNSYYGRVRGASISKSLKNKHTKFFKHFMNKIKYSSPKDNYFVMRNNNIIDSLMIFFYYY